MNFASDNAVGASPKVMEAIAAANHGSASAYGADPWTARVERALSELFEREVAVALVATGTAANALAIASVTRPWGAVLTHASSHINEDEGGAPEFFADGAKLVGIAGVGCKLAPDAVGARLADFVPGAVRHVQPQCLSITQATEDGLVYRPEEIAALAEAVRPRGLAVHMDGARFANAVAALGCSPAEITWRAGVDALSFGGTKNGAWAAEAVVFFDPALAGELAWRRKRGGHTLSKGRLVAAQFEALLDGGHWLDLARHANAMARRLASGFAAAGVGLAWPCEANAVFPILPSGLAAALRRQGAVFHDWTERSLPAGIRLEAGDSIGRFVCSFATSPEQVDALLGLVSRAGRDAA